MLDNEFQIEAENRIRNLMWTVSGDYSLDIKPDLKAWSGSKHISMYDAVKQGAFARYFDRDQFGMYLIKKMYYGAEEQPLTELAQLCVDVAGYPKVSAERPGIPELRKKAFEDLMEHSFHKMNSTIPGRIKIALLRGYLSDDWHAEKQLQTAVEKIRSLERSRDTMDIIRVTDDLYNSLIDKSFVRKHGDLEHVLSVPTEDLKEFDWSDYLEEVMDEELLDQYLKKINSQVVTMQEERDEEQKNEPLKGQRRITVITPEAAAKMYSYIELNYGRSYLSELEQKRLNQRLCRGAHADCSLYYTDGILANPVLTNAQYVNASRHASKNQVAFHNHYYTMLRNIEQLTDELRRSLHRRSEPETSSAWCGEIIPGRLWRIGRTEETGRLFQKTAKRNISDFAVSILMDASGSQRDRQSQVAIQAYIISESLSNNHIPHQITSFCSFWDYTILQRFREYDDPREKNKQLMNYVTSSNNRDGLAIRAEGDSLLQRQEEGKILIVLSDGKPNDVIVNRPNCKNPRPYFGDYAVRDTAFEVRKLRGSGVCVLGVFTGKEQELMAEKKIFGKDFAYIRSIEGFSKIVSRYLRKLLEDGGANF